MGLVLPQTIDVKIIGNRHLSYYENLGYDIPKYPASPSLKKKKNRDFAYDKNASFTIDVVDLWPGSEFYVNVTCDRCGKLYQKNYRKYYKCKNKGCYCKPCAAIITHSGENNVNWRDDLTYEDRINKRMYPEYAVFVKSVLKRDNYTCQRCKIHGGALEVHHLDGYHWNKEGRTDISNGVTLCQNCHSIFHHIYGNKNNTKKQFEEWLDESINLSNIIDTVVDYNKIYCVDDGKVYNSPKHLKTVYQSNTIPNAHYKCLYEGKVIIPYNDYINMSQEDINDYAYVIRNKSKKKNVICLETSELFEDPNIAAQKYNVTKAQIYRACNRTDGKYIAGTLPDGTVLHWMYQFDYNIASENDIEKKKYMYTGQSHGVICLNTGVLYQQIIFASRDNNINQRKVQRSCTGFTKHCKNDNGIELRFMYYKDFINLSDAERNKIYLDYKDSFYEGSFLMNRFIKEEEMFYVDK